MKEIKFVDVGEGITEGHVAKWLVKNWEQVKEDQPIVQVETDKAVVSVPSPISGTVKIIAQENSTLKVGDTVAIIGEPAELGDATSAASIASKDYKPPAQQQTAPAQTQQAAPVQAKKEVITTPSVRHLAHELGVDISTVTGTGPNGRVLENDVRATVSGQTEKQAPVQKFSEILEELNKMKIERQPMSQTRKAIARNMELSGTIPAAVHMDLANGAPLYDVVSREKERVMKELNVKLTFLPFIIKAVVQALKNNPRLNSSYDKEKQEIIVKKYYNIGLAAEGPDGLKVVVIKDCDKKNIVRLAKEIQSFHDKVLNQTITIEEMRDSTFTITNIGSLGGGFLSVPMINYPEVAILGVHLLRDFPVVVDGRIKPGKILPLSLAFDHRVVDGAEAARFMNEVKGYIEDPEFLDLI